MKFDIIQKKTQRFWKIFDPLMSVKDQLKYLFQEFKQIFILFKKKLFKINNFINRSTFIILINRGAHNIFIQRLYSDYE